MLYPQYDSALQSVSKLDVQYYMGHASEISNRVLTFQPSLGMPYWVPCLYDMLPIEWREISELVASQHIQQDTEGYKHLSYTLAFMRLLDVSFHRYRGVSPNQLDRELFNWLSPLYKDVRSVVKNCAYKTKQLWSYFQDGRRLRFSTDFHWDTFFSQHGFFQGRDIYQWFATCNKWLDEAIKQTNHKLEEVKNIARDLASYLGMDSKFALEISKLRPDEINDPVLTVSNIGTLIRQCISSLINAGKDTVKKLISLHDNYQEFKDFLEFNLDITTLNKLLVITS